MAGRWESSKVGHRRALMSVRKLDRVEYGTQVTGPSKPDRHQSATPRSHLSTWEFESSERRRRSKRSRRDSSDESVPPRAHPSGLEILVRSCGAVAKRQT